MEFRTSGSRLPCCRESTRGRYTCHTETDLSVNTKWPGYREKGGGGLPFVFARGSALGGKLLLQIHHPRLLLFLRAPIHRERLLRTVYELNTTLSGKAFARRKGEVGGACLMIWKAYFSSPESGMSRTLKVSRFFSPCLPLPNSIMRWNVYLLLVLPAVSLVYTEACT